jgi:transposase InsO family protein
MSKKGCSPDNSACEGFFGRLKNECFYNKTFAGVTAHEFIAYIDRYILWYNTKRIKKSLGYLSPAEYRRQQLQAA